MASGDNKKLVFLWCRVFNRSCMMSVEIVPVVPFLCKMFYVQAGNVRKIKQ